MNKFFTKILIVWTMLVSAPSFALDFSKMRKLPFVSIASWCCRQPELALGLGLSDGGTSGASMIGVRYLAMKVGTGIGNSDELGMEAGIGAVGLISMTLSVGAVSKNRTFDRVYPQLCGGMLIGTFCTRIVYDFIDKTISPEIGLQMWLGGVP